MTNRNVLRGNRAEQAPHISTSSDPLRLRDQRHDDEPFLRGLFFEAHAGLLADLEPELRDMLLGHQFAGQTASYRSAYPAARFQIVTEAGMLIGRLVTNAGPTETRLVDIAVLAAFRGRGVGEWLVRQVIESARLSASVVRLSVRPNNHDAERLYRRCGFDVVARSELEVEMERRPVG